MHDETHSEVNLSQIKLVSIWQNQRQIAGHWDGAQNLLVDNNCDYPEWSDKDGQSPLVAKSATGELGIGLDRFPRG